MRRSKRTPTRATPERFDMWCYRMVMMGNPLREVARVAQVSVETVKNAVVRVKCGRYGEVEGIDGR